MHLGMSGSFRVLRDAGESTPGQYHHERSASSWRTTTWCSTWRNGAVVTFNDPRRFGSMKLVPRAELEQEPLLRALGPEPLGNAFDAAMLARACRGKKTSLKAALSDQRIVAGLGNIYVCEALHRARLSPKRRASTIATQIGRAARARASGWSMRSRRCSTTPSRPAARRCATTAAPTARSATSSTISASTTATASAARPPGCGGTIRRIVQTGRSTFFCPVCQR